MKPSQITQIVVRLFALVWFLRGTIQVVGIFTLSDGGTPTSPLFIGGVVVLVVAFGAWFLAPRLGRLISQGNDQEVVAGLSFAELLHAMFVGLGLFFCLSSGGGLINNLHFFLVQQARFPGSTPSGMGLSLYDLSRSAVTFAAGVFLIVSAPYWARRIAQKAT